MRQYLLAAICVLFLSACGGGDARIETSSTLRTDLYYGYFITSDTQVAETKNHVNLLWVGGPFGEDIAIANIQAAKLPTVLDVSVQLYEGPTSARTLKADGEQKLRELFAKMRLAGVLQYVVAITPIDEPDGSVANQADVLVGNRTIRTVAAEFAELSNVKLAVIYAGSERLTNIEDFDWVGFDDYGSKSKIFTNGQYEALVNRLRPDQRTLIVPGGFEGQDPVPFFNWAQQDKRVVAIVPFLWTDTTDFKGIRSLPVKQAYCEAGEKIKYPERVPLGVC